MLRVVTCEMCGARFLSHEGKQSSYCWAKCWPVVLAEHQEQKRAQLLAEDLAAGRAEEVIIQRLPGDRSRVTIRKIKRIK